MAASSSSEVGSIQWMSSKITKTGCRAATAVELSRQRRQGLLLAFLRTQLLQSVALVARQCAEGWPEPRRVPGPPWIAQPARRVWPVFAVGVVAALEPGSTFELADEREESAVGVMRRAEIAQRDVRFAPSLLVERERDVRLADARLARQHHHAAFPLRGMPPSAQQQFDLLFTPEQRRQLGLVHRLEAALPRRSLPAPAKPVSAPPTL